MATPTYLLSDADTVKTLVPDLRNLSDAEMSLLLEVTSSAVQQYTGRNLRTKRYSYVSTSSYYDSKRAILNGTGSKKLYLPEWPITTVDAVYLDGESVTASDISLITSYADSDKYKIYADEGYLFLETGWNKGSKNVHLVYTAGYTSSDYPKNWREIDMIMSQLCAALWPLLENSGGIFRDEKLGEYQYSIGYNAQYLIKDLTTQVLPGHPLVAMALENYTASVYRNL